MTRPITIECNIHFERSGRGSRKHVRKGQVPSPTPIPSGRIPRVARFMALAIRFTRPGTPPFTTILMTLD